MRKAILVLLLLLAVVGVVSAADLYKKITFMQNGVVIRSFENVQLVSRKVITGLYYYGCTEYVLILSNGSRKELIVDPNVFVVLEKAQK